MSSCFFKQSEDENSKFTKNLIQLDFLAVFLNLYTLSLLLATLARFCRCKL